MTTHTSKESGASQCKRILQELVKHRRRGVSMLHLHKVSKSLAVHSRIADLRKIGHQIENRCIRVNGKTHSEYRLL